MEASRVLVVDDEPHVVTGLKIALEYEGYEVEIATDGPAALVAVTTFDPDAIVLDIGIPGLTGLAVTRALRSTGIRVPVLLVTARSAIEERVSGLDVGADDYLVKPFDIEELLARVRALLRRSAQPPEDELRWKNLILVVSDQRLSDGRSVVLLTKNETSVLAVLMAEPHKSHPKQSIASAVWPEQPPQSNAVEVCISGLRRKLAASALTEGRRILRTVRGLGYRMNE